MVMESRPALTVEIWLQTLDATPRWASLIFLPNLPNRLCWWKLKTVQVAEWLPLRQIVPEKSEAHNHIEMHHGNITYVITKVQIDFIELHIIYIITHVWGINIFTIKIF